MANLFTATTPVPGSTAAHNPDEGGQGDPAGNGRGGRAYHHGTTPSLALGASALTKNHANQGDGAPAKASAPASTTSGCWTWTHSS
jgi:hypothetical protein